MDKEDKAMSSCRESIEWSYGEAKMLFPYTVQKDKLKIMSGMPLKEIYFCRVLLANLYICFYGNKTSARFRCTPPTPEEYMQF